MTVIVMKVLVVRRFRFLATLCGLVETSRRKTYFALKSLSFQLTFFAMNKDYRDAFRKLLRKVRKASTIAEVSLQRITESGKATANKRTPDLMRPDHNSRAWSTYSVIASGCARKPPTCDLLIHEYGVCAFYGRLVRCSTVMAGIVWLLWRCMCPMCTATVISVLLNRFNRGMLKHGEDRT